MKTSIEYLYNNIKRTSTQSFYTRLRMTMLRLELAADMELLEYQQSHGPEKDVFTPLCPALRLPSLVSGYTTSPMTPTSLVLSTPPNDTA